MALRAVALLASVVAGLLGTSCGGSGVSAGAVSAYLSAVEPIRLGVNRLLDDADPILDGYRAHRLTGSQAAAEMSKLEDRFAAYMVDVNALVPADPTLAALHAPYAHTFILEDSYLNAVVADLPDGDFSNLPNTQAEQRAAIIEWRVELEVLGRAVGMTLPSDLQQAGRGEIAPSVTSAS